MNRIIYITILHSTKKMHLKKNLSPKNKLSGVVKLSSAGMKVKCLGPGTLKSPW